MIPLARKIRTTSIAMLGLLSLIVTSLPAQAACYGWPLREYRGEYAYDGDTIYVAIPGLPGEIANMSVRVRGVDTPEIRGKCESEKHLAKQARDYARNRLKSAKSVEFCEPEWGRYGGRVVASVRIDGSPLDVELISNGLARAYDGKTKRQPWCQG
ncbi:thermonuclease family protein [Thalassospira lucentensis]|uniref:thermonuclease family protein n=1 Tax=Thalassospira lucentensis TaxID=168935 RepID=UPI0023F37FD7|nr:thermonuclease family protein [Thalassospira lucentensis]|tara:strand:- start:92 stop:559 length:468 start_codon:yes stop_codon:yes gene_type:complete